MILVTGFFIYFLSGLTWYGAINRLSLAWTTALVIPGIPILSILFAVMFLGERATTREVVGILISVSGVLALVLGADPHRKQPASEAAEAIHEPLIRSEQMGGASARFQSTGTGSAYALLSEFRFLPVANARSRQDDRNCALLSEIAYSHRSRCSLCQDGRDCAGAAAPLRGDALATRCFVGMSLLSPWTTTVSLNEVGSIGPKF